VLEDHWVLKVNDVIIVYTFLDKTKISVDSNNNNRNLQQNIRLTAESNEISQIANQSNVDKISKKISNSISKNKGGRPKGSTKRSRPLTVDGERRKKRAISRKSYAKRKIEKANDQRQ